MITLAAILFTAGIIYGVLLYLNSESHSDMDKAEKKREIWEENLDGVNAAKALKKKTDKNLPRLRICPVCGKALKKHEYLFASMEEARGQEKRQVKIYGCRYCYLGLSDDPAIREGLEL